MFHCEQPLCCGHTLAIKTSGAHSAGVVVSGHSKGAQKCGSGLMIFWQWLPVRIASFRVETVAPPSGAGNSACQTIGHAQKSLLCGWPVFCLFGLLTQSHEVSLNVNVMIRVSTRFVSDQPND